MLTPVAFGNGRFCVQYGSKEGGIMLSENIKTTRKAKGLSQEELAVRLNVVRQTVSKWEQGVSLS